MKFSGKKVVDVGLGTKAANHAGKNSNLRSKIVGGSKLLNRLSVLVYQRKKTLY